MSPSARESSEWEAASGLFRVLASPLRVGIIQLLAVEPRTVGDLVRALAVAQPLVSQHLRVLRDQCLVAGERDGRETRYRLMDDHVAHIVADAVSHTGEHNHGAPDHGAPKDRASLERADPDDTDPGKTDPDDTDPDDTDPEKTDTQRDLEDAP